MSLLRLRFMRPHYAELIVTGQFFNVALSSPSNNMMNS